MQDIRDIQSHLEKFKNDLVSLTNQLTAAATAVQKEGIVPGKGLSDQLEKFLIQFQVLRAEIRKEADALGVVLTGSTASPVKVADLDEAVDLCLKKLQAGMKEVTTARALLAQILTIRHADDPAFAPLKECQTKAVTLDKNLAGATALTPPEDLKKWIEDTKSYGLLDELVTKGDVLDDQRCDELREGISAGFGSALAMAASRGKLKQGEAPAPTPPPAAMKPMPPAPEPEVREVAPAPAPIIPDPQTPNPAGGTPFPWMTKG